MWGMGCSETGLYFAYILLHAILCTRYIMVGGFQEMVLLYEWERDISDDFYESKYSSIFQHDVSVNGAFACLAANSAPKYILHTKKVALQNLVVEFPKLKLSVYKWSSWSHVLWRDWCPTAILFSIKIKVATCETDIFSTVGVHFRRFWWEPNDLCLRSRFMELLESNVAVIS